MSRFRGGPGFARPENALKRADELENVGQKALALQALHDLITNKKHRTWSKTYESIMFKLIDLCVEMRKRNHAKEALMQYRNMCQQVNINSLEEVIKYYLNKTTEKAEEARQKAEAVSLDAVEDLEEDAKPEDLMLSYVSGEKSKDRTDREMVTPWFRFLWESYRSVLEILRTNPKLEALYAMVAQRAFQFCLTYRRNAEFRRLCDILRQHLANMAKYREQRDISAPESLNLHLETRFEQLRVACELGMWAEAFRSVEDIQGLVALGKRQPKQQMMATYYSRLTQIFAVSEAHLYHAYAWLKLFTFSRSYNKNLTQSDVAMMATSVVLATLSILPFDRPLFGRSDEVTAEQDKERTLRMAGILGFTVDKRADVSGVLTRGALLTAIGSMNLLALVPPEVRTAYDLLTSEFNPLQLCHKLAPVLEGLDAISSPMSAASPIKDLGMAIYIPALKNVAVARLLRQLGDVYSTITIAELAHLVPFMGLAGIEAIVVDAVKYEYLQVRINHRSGTLHFGSTQLESDKIRGHLALLAKRLAKAATMINPAPAPAAEARCKAAAELARAQVEQEHKRSIARKQVIEKRKEQQEALLMEQEAAEAARRQQLAREQQLLEERRQKEEAARREKERLEKELEEKDMEEARALLEQANKKKKVVFKDGDKLDKKALMQEALHERLKEAHELERKLARLAKAMDHLERARREEEAPFLVAAYEARLVQDKVRHEEAQAQFLEQHRAAWEVDVVEKRRMERMRGDRDAFAAAVVSRRQEEFEELRRARERRAAERRAARKNEREITRRREFVKRSRAMVEERVIELVEAAKKAEEEKRRAELAERQRKLDEAAARQRAREEEIERKLKEEKAAMLAGRVAAPAPAPAAAPAAAAAAGGAGDVKKFVPPALRRQMQAGDSGGGGAPAAAAAAAEGERGSGGGSSGGGWRGSNAPPAARESEDRWGGRRDDGPPRRDDGPPRRDDGPPRRDDGPPPRRDDGPPPRRDDGPPGGARPGAYAPPSRRTGDDSARPAGAYRPPVRRDDGPPPPRTTSGSGGGSRW